MDASEARRTIAESLTQGSRTPCTWRSNRDAYIAEKSQELIAALIDPVMVSVVNRTYDHEHRGIAEFANAVAVARNGESWLLYIPNASHFALAFGKDAESLLALGFSSSDALAEWLG